METAKAFKEDCSVVSGSDCDDHPRVTEAWPGDNSENLSADCPGSEG